MTIGLERELVELGDGLDVPDAPDLAAMVTARLRTAPAPRLRRRRRVVAAVVAVVAAAVGVSFVPAVADWLGIRGVEVHREAPPFPPAGRELDLGQAVTLTEAREIAGFMPRVPSHPGRPDGVWVDTRPGVPVVSLVWTDGPLVSEFRGAIAEETVIEKFAGPGVRVEPVTVRGHPGLWVDGAHAVAIKVGDHVVPDRLRLSQSALLVEVGDLTVRIETAKGRAEAVRIARSIPGT